MDKQRCQYELWVEEYFGLPCDFPTQSLVPGADYHQLVNMLAMYDTKRNQSLRSELQKLKELNAELVEGLSKLAQRTNITNMINEQDKQRILSEEERKDGFAKAKEFANEKEEGWMLKSADMSLVRHTYSTIYFTEIIPLKDELERSEKLHKEEEVKAEQNAFHLVKALDLLDECHHYLKANPPDKSKMTYNKWESLIEETDYMREFNSEAEYERINGSEKLLQEYREIIRGLIPIAQDSAINYIQRTKKQHEETIQKAKSLIEPLRLVKCTSLNTVILTTLEEAMERAPKSSEWEQRIISLIKKSKES